MQAPRRPKRSTSRSVNVAAAAAALPLALSFIPSGSGTGVAATCGVHCGTERWHVKTLSDASASQVTLEPKTTTVANLVSIAPPAQLGEDERDPTEMQAVTVNAQLVGYKEELSSGKGDHDFHIVIQDPASNDTMIVEIPDPQCDGVCNSVAGDQIKAARDAFASTFQSSPPRSSFVKFQHPVRVTVTGVPLFDFHHGQTGVARNCIEIHPVLSLTFPDGPPAERPAKGSVPALADDDYDCISE
ncbi:MAG TPA: hypothetical protein VK665_18920 [Candidatus Elarobacter sp.]|nr:hypothetical protein [Candidatus Elarobacter sp.]